MSSFLSLFLCFLTIPRRCAAQRSQGKAIIPLAKLNRNQNLNLKPKLSTSVSTPRHYRSTLKTPHHTTPHHTTPHHTIPHHTTPYHTTPHHTTPHHTIPHHTTPYHTTPHHTTPHHTTPPAHRIASVFSASPITFPKQ
ncbi:hypothetical protein CC80DRAFT_244254 [Byssothecium circinans]|uniref:Uncharacterized protein n=1 Tax=Byssothecium circinans TaxID=147558 RepID=A0A6A5TMF5_9PLEO|nr:hypothetical protein CC80DRAFT_244254 [Byssothecium circinans]